MTGWYAELSPGRSARAVIAVTLLALLLVAAVPVVLLAGVVMMLLGHVVGGLALFGGSILAAAIAVVVAGMRGMRPMSRARPCIPACAFEERLTRVLVVYPRRTNEPHGAPRQPASGAVPGRGVAGQSHAAVLAPHRSASCRTLASASTSAKCQV